MFTYPNILLPMLQVLEAKMSDTGDGMTMNLVVSDGLNRTQRCWLSPVALQRVKNEIQVNAIIWIKAYQLLFLPV